MAERLLHVTFDQSAVSTERTPADRNELWGITSSSTVRAVTRVIKTQAVAQVEKSDPKNGDLGHNFFFWLGQRAFFVDPRAGLLRIL